MLEYSLIDFKVRGDHNGSLVALEKGEDFPFEIKRVYYIWGTAKDAVRGRHSHRNLEQVIICTSGSCDFILDNGRYLNEGLIFQKEGFGGRTTVYQTWEIGL